MDVRAWSELGKNGAFPGPSSSVFYSGAYDLLLLKNHTSNYYWLFWGFVWFL